MNLKYILQLSFLVIISATIFGCSGTKLVKSDPPMEAASVKNLIDNQSFVFIPKYVHPLSGRTRNLDYGFQISVSKDTIVSYLPFMGRGYTAPLSPTDIDFDFTSTNFKTIVSPSKRGWNISIKPKDKGTVSELYFTIYDNASASLNVVSNDRSAISYDGYITERRFEKNQKK
jgi:hypothetical protein